MSVATGKTKLVTINAATATAIVADIDSAELVIVEDNSVVGAPTTDLLIYMPDTNASPIQWPGGVPFTIQRGRSPIFAAETAAYVKTATGTTSLAVIHRARQ